MATEITLTAAQRDDLRIIAGVMIPASAEYGVPGADDAIIQADIVATLGRDAGMVRQALDQLAQLAGMPFADLDAVRRAVVATQFRASERCGCSHPRPRGAAKLLSRRPGVALTGIGAAAAFPERIYAGTGRLVAARSREGACPDVAASSVRAPL